MIPILLGVISSSISKVTGVQYTLPTDCTYTSTIVFYMALGGVPNTPGATIYQDANLTTPYLSVSWVYNSTQYSSDGTGVINSENSPCYSFVEGYTNCSNSIPLTLYYQSAEVLQIGTILYTDTGLTTIYANNVFVTLGSVYQTDSTGTVISIITCLTENIVYNSCSDYNTSTSPFSLYSSSSISNGITVYTDAEGTTFYQNSFFVYNGNQYNTDSNGVVSDAGSCV